MLVIKVYSAFLTVANKSLVGGDNFLRKSNISQVRKNPEKNSFESNCVCLKWERVVLLFDVFPSNHVPGVRCPADYIYRHNNGLPT